MGPDLRIEESRSPKSGEKKKGILMKVAVRLFFCVVLLAAGIIAMKRFEQMKKPPDEADEKERPIRVEVMRAEVENAPVFMTGYGEARSLNIVAIAPEVSGKVVEIHPALEKGEIVEKDSLLFRIDTSDYEASLREIRATAKQMGNTVLRLKKQYEIDRKRQKTLERNRALSEAEFKRVKRLFEKDRVGTRSGVDAAEQRYNTVSDQADQMARAVELYPIRIKEAENSLSAARARMSAASTRLSRCEVRAPFEGRVRTVNIEKGQYAAPGAPAVVLADDSVLEIETPLDSREARQWLRFDGKSSGDNAWFNIPEYIECKVRWTEAQDDHSWRGSLHRVVEFDRKTRTLTVAVRISGRDIAASDSAMPLVDGMFCSVEIPGRTLENVVSVPSWAVSFKNTVFISKGKRLKTVPVTVARTQGERSFISSGIEPGDLIITTRLVDPLENSLLEFDEG